MLAPAERSAIAPGASVDGTCARLRLETQALRRLLVVLTRRLLPVLSEGKWREIGFCKSMGSAKGARPGHGDARS